MDFLRGRCRGTMEPLCQKPLPRGKPPFRRRFPFCQGLANFPRFCQGLAKLENRAAEGFANVWQIRADFAKHWQNALGRGLRTWVERNGVRDYGNAALSLRPLRSLWLEIFNARESGFQWLSMLETLRPSRTLRETFSPRHAAGSRIPQKILSIL